jgi:hypothetical protein
MTAERLVRLVYRGIMAQACSMPAGRQRLCCEGRFLLMQGNMARQQSQFLLQSRHKNVTLRILNSSIKGGIDDEKFDQPKSGASRRGQKGGK